jgi:O-antigen/teichoic acid export membrane protein
MGTVIGQGAIVLAAPLITRLYSPAEMGLYAVFGSLLGILSVISSLHYELAIPLPRKDRDGFNILLLSIVSALFFTAVVTVLGLLIGDQLLALIKAPALFEYIWFFPIALLLFSVNRNLIHWGIRKETFSINAVGRMVQGPGQVLPQIGLGIHGLGVLGLIAGQLTGQVLGFLALVRGLFHSTVTYKQVDIKKIQELAHEYRRFPLFTTWSSLVNTLAAHLPVLMLTSYFGATVTGLYALSFRILQVPMRFLGQSVSQVFFSVAVEANNDGHIQKSTMAVYGKLVRIGLPSLLLIAVCAPDLFVLGFGERWKAAGVYSRLLMPWLFFSFLSSTLSSLVSVLQQQTRELLIQLFYVVTIAGSLICGGQIGDPNITMMLLGGLGGGCLMSKVLWLMHISGNSVVRSLLVLLSEFFWVIPFALPLLLLKWLEAGRLLLCLAGALCIALSLVTNMHFRVNADE